MKELFSKSDEELMQEYQQGNVLAFEEIYRRYSGKIYGFLRFKLRNQSMVDDIFQTTFMKLHHSRSTYDCKYQFKPWIFTICRNTMIDYFRKLQLENDLPQELEIQETSEGPEQTDFDKELSELPENQRLAMEYRFYQDFSFEEIAEKLKTSPSNARQLISRGIKRLKNLVAIKTKKTGI